MMKMFKRAIPITKPVPHFDPSPTKRFFYTFIGTVQNVGFRIELTQRAKQLGLVGWVKNCADGSVEAEIQGAQNRIDALIASMKAIPRIKITHLTRVEQALKDEFDFKLL